MSNFDRRETQKNTSQPIMPDDDDMAEDYQPTISNYRRAYHIRADVKSEFAASEGGFATYHILAEVTSEFAASAGEEAKGRDYTMPVLHGPPDDPEEDHILETP